MKKGNILGRGIAISGRAGSGKDTIADIVLALAKSDGFDGKKYGFADALKSYCSEKFGYDNHLNYTQVGKASYNQKEGKSIRDILIDESAKKRAISQTYWVDKVLDQIQIDKPDFYVISDCRYKFEADPLKAEGAIIVRLIVSPEDRYQRINDLSVVNSVDESETGLDAYDFTEIYQNGNHVDPIRVATQIWENFKTRGER